MLLERCQLAVGEWLLLRGSDGLAELVCLRFRVEDGGKYFLLEQGQLLSRLHLRGCLVLRLALDRRVILALSPLRAREA